MGIDRETLRQLREIIRPLANRIHNTAARAVVKLVDDGRKLQQVQLGVLAGETIDGAEHFQPYGLSSVPLDGAEAVAVFPSGDRSHPLVVVVSDRRNRPTGGDPGDVVLYNNEGAKVTLKGADIEVTPGPGGKVVMAGASTLEGVVVGTGVDPFTGLTYTALTNASTKVFAKK